jgi:hypothetical protein
MFLFFILGLFWTAPLLLWRRRLADGFCLVAATAKTAGETPAPRKLLYSLEGVACSIERGG